MKKYIFLILLVPLLFSCITVSGYMPESDEDQGIYLGTVSKTYFKFHFLHIKPAIYVVNERGSSEKLAQEAHSRLLEKAQRQYPDQRIYLRNINVSGDTSWLTYANIFAGFGLYGSIFNYSANAMVFSESIPESSDIETMDIKDLNRAILQAFDLGDRNTVLAVLGFTNLDGRYSLLGKYIAEQLTTLLFQESNIDIVERSLVDSIISEWKFSSSYVNEADISSIGSTMGATAIVTGSLTKIGNTIEVNARIIDVESANVLATAAITLTGGDYIDMYSQIID